MKNILIIPFLFLMAACATSSIDGFNKIQVGMDKDEVLNLVGNPKNTERSNGIEKWSYRYYSEEESKKENLKFVKFANGKVTEFGEDAEEAEHLETLKNQAQKKESIKKKKQQIDKKVEDAYKKK